MAENVHELRPKPADTEKITINLGFVDLGHVDLMVQEGFYSNRTDFIRTAIRNQLERHADVVKRSTSRKNLDLGLRNYSREDLEVARRAGEMLQINVLGLASIAQDVTPELARAAIASDVDARRMQRTALSTIFMQNLTKEITVEELAAAASLSRLHFSRMFKIATAQSPSRFIGRLRLELSKSLLIAGKSIADVANDCGFSSESNFVRSFRRSTGITPGQYRNRARKPNSARRRDLLKTAGGPGAPATRARCLLRCMSQKLAPSGRWQEREGQPRAKRRRRSGTSELSAQESGTPCCVGTFIAARS